MSNKPLNILVSGSGIAGSVFAYWILRAYPNANVTIVERDPALRLTGASVDIRNAGVDIIKKMGVEQIIRDNCTHEEGMSFVTASDWSAATLLATGRTDVQSFTSEFEIYRGSLAKIFISLVSSRVKMIFNETVESYTQTASSVTVTFTKSQEVETYDLLVAADGVSSKIRAQMIDSTEPLKRLWATGLPTAYFTVKKDLLDGGKLAKWYSAPGGRCILLRPDFDPEGRTRANIMHIAAKKGEKEKLNEAMRGGNASFMTALEELYADAGWKSKEVLEGMRGSDDFYCSMFGEIRSPKLQDGRVVLLGDAGYATPGIGTSLAIIGAYVLAGEIMRKEGNMREALEGYDGIIMPFIKPMGGGHNSAMSFVNPQSRWGIALRNTVLGVITRLKIDQMGVSLVAMMGWTENNIKMPDYQWPAEVDVDAKILADV